MQVIPVLDLRSGRAVHARVGARSTYAPVSSQLIGGRVGDPIALARAYRTVLHCAEVYVADLDAILAGAPQHDVVRAVAAQGGSCWVDMAVDSPHRAIETMADGASRVVVGLETLTTREGLEPIVDAVGASRVVFSLDLREGQPLTRAHDLAHMGAAALAELAAEAGVRTVIMLDLARVGTGCGVDLALVRHLRRAVPDVAIVVGGGIAGMADLEALAAAGAQGALVGSALHDGRIGAAEIEAIAHRGEGDG